VTPVEQQSRSAETLTEGRPGSAGPEASAPDIAGTWTLESWQRFGTDGTTTSPLGPRPDGMLIYGPDGAMAVMMAEAGRPHLDTDDPVGGTVEARAAAYSSCLAYVGRWRVDGATVIHDLETSLFPNWAGTEQERPFLLDDERLALRMHDPDGRLTNEITWRRRAAD
jgi:hypothetical protein